MPFHRLLLAVLAAALASSARSELAAPASPSLAARAESAFRQFVFYDDQAAVTAARGASKSLDGTPRAALERRRSEWKARLSALLDRLPPTTEPTAGDRALASMRAALAARAPADPNADRAAGCDYDPAALVASGGIDALERRLYSCFGRAAESIPFGDRRLSRLEVLDLLPLTDDAARRRELFMALAGVWRAVNRDNEPASPYRTLVSSAARAWPAGASPLDRVARDAGLDLATLERWIVQALERWRTTRPDAPVEPWDFAYTTRRASRALSGRLRTVADLEAVRDRYGRALAAVRPAGLGIHFDLAPRIGKDPVAYTAFGRRSYGSEGRWIRGEFWVFASYSTGSFDNLYELLHETGHGIHLAAIRTRPAFADYPDSDAFTEALADLIGLEVYEPEWQERFLGSAATRAQALEEKYSGIVLDLAWGLFEARMYRNPDLDPNRLWTEITGEYLRIQPHPELSWWAVRGQLVDSPGYMLAYGLGAFMAAALRERVKELRGEGALRTPRPDLYAWLTERLYRYGLERHALRVLEQFLDRTLDPGPLLRDLGRGVISSRAARGRGDPRNPPDSGSGAPSPHITALREPHAARGVRAAAAAAGAWFDPKSPVR